MPYLTSLSIRISRKFQIEKDDWVGVDALATVAVEDDEAHLVDPADIRRLAREQAKAAIREQLAEEIAERDERRRQRAADRLSALAPNSNGHADEPPPPPQTTEEAEQRFYARWGDVVGGQTWADVQRYTGIRGQSPTTIRQWYAAAEAVYRRSQQA